MSKISVKNLTFAYEDEYENVFENATFSMDSEWKVGIVGRNGIGKTTFLKILEGKLPYYGIIEMDCKCEYYPYSIHDLAENTETVILNALGPFAEYEKRMKECLEKNTEQDIDEYISMMSKYTEIGGYDIRNRIKAELIEMHINENVLYKKWHILSEGEKTKIKIIILFLKHNDFLLLDEPTNHLDIEGRQILAEYLNKKNGYIVVSHDRFFLNKCIDHVIEIRNNKINIFQGNCDSWLENKKKSDEYYKDVTEYVKNEKDRLIKSANNMRPWLLTAGDRTTDKFRRRINALNHRAENMDKITSELVDERDVEGKIKINYEEPQKGEVLRVTSAEFGYDANEPLIKEMSFVLNKGDRIAIIGKNGIGKSTLLNSIIAENPLKGVVKIKKEIKISRLKQDYSCLRGNIRNFFQEEGVDFSVTYAVLKQLGIKSYIIEKDLSELSEGEKKKTALAVELVRRANIYFWDEPLNYLDIISRRQIEEAILIVKPTMIFVEHDREFIENVATGRLEIQ